MKCFDAMKQRHRLCGENRATIEYLNSRLCVDCEWFKIDPKSSVDTHDYCT